MTNQLDAHKYKAFLKEVKERILKAQYDGLKKVNKELIDLYWVSEEISTVNKSNQDGENQ